MLLLLVVVVVMKRGIAMGSNATENPWDNSLLSSNEARRQRDLAT